MTIPSRVMGSGNSALATTSICGYAATALTAVGTNLATGLQLNADINVVSTAAASTGVVLPTAENGVTLVIANDGANTLAVYAKSGSTIDGSASTTIATTKRRVFYGTSATTWVSVLGA